MAEWKKVGMVRKFAHLKISPNTTYNIKNETGIYFENPNLIFGFEKVIALTSSWNASADLVLSNGNFSINTHPSISKNSMINVVVFEGDLSNGDGSRGGEFRKIATLKKTRVVKLDKSNNFSVNLSGVDGNGAWDIKKTKFVTMLGYISMTKYDLGYDITPVVSGHNIIISPKTIKYKGTKRRVGYYEPYKDETVQLRDDCCFFSVLIGGRSNKTSEDWVGIRFYEDSVLKYETQSARKKTGDSYSYANNKKYGQPKTIRFSSYGNAVKEFKCILDQHIYEETELLNCEVYLFLIEEGE